MKDEINYDDLIHSTQPEIKEGMEIYWRRKKQEEWHKAYIHEIISTNKGTLIAIHESKYTGYPHRYLLNEIDILVTT